mmetsp:Transcript_27391/g.87951  ORF Transcript_27391/g.87951 Transcript_27391/m.87951 type:complete len:254 (-) Transcript_27391:373-1134(-)
MSLTRAKEISKSHRGTRACTLSERSHRAHSSHRVPPRGEGRRRLGLGAAAAGQPHQRLAHARHRLPPHPRNRKEGGVEVVDGVQREEGATVPGRPVEAAARAARSHARVAALIPRAASSAARREGRGLERPAGRHLPPARRQLGARRRLVARPRSADRRRRVCCGLCGGARRGGQRRGGVHGGAADRDTRHVDSPPALVVDIDWLPRIMHLRDGREGEAGEGLSLTPRLPPQRVEERQERREKMVVRRPVVRV